MIRAAWRSVAPLTNTFARRQAHSLAATHSGLKSDEIFNPTDEHRQLRDVCADFAVKKIAPQASEYDAKGWCC